MARREYQNPKLQIRESARGPEYFIRYRMRVMKMIDGRPVVIKQQKHQPIGLVAEMTKRQAERERDRIKDDINRQVYHIQAKIPFEDFIAQYRKTALPELAVPTQHTYDQWLRIYVEPFFKGRELGKIRTLDVQEFLNSLELAATTKNSIRGVLASVFRRAAEWGYWDQISPVENVRTPKRVERKRERRIWTPEELDKILDAVRPDVKLIIETLVWTGMRISECLGLTPAAFNLERGTVSVTTRQCRGDVSRTKTERGTRVLPLGTLAARYESVIEGKNPGDFIFTDDLGRPYKDCELLANYLTPILKKLGLKFEGAGWHTLRRMHLTWFSDQDVSDRDLMDQAGHADLKTTRMYLIQRSVNSRAAALKAMQEQYEREKTTRKVDASGLRRVK